MATQEIVIESRLGKRTVTTDKILEFPRGLIGYEDQRRFTLLQIKEDSPFLVLQSLDDPRLGLIVADPYTFLTEYEIRLETGEQRLLKVDDVSQVAVLVTVSIPAGNPEKTALNLMGPIVINHEARLGAQIPQMEGRFPTHHFLHQD